MASPTHRTTDQKLYETLISLQTQMGALQENLQQLCNAVPNLDPFNIEAIYNAWGVLKGVQILGFNIQLTDAEDEYSELCIKGKCPAHRMEAIRMMLVECRKSLSLVSVGASMVKTDLDQYLSSVRFLALGGFKENEEEEEGEGEEGEEEWEGEGEGEEGGGGEGEMDGEVRVEVYEIEEGD